MLQLVKVALPQTYRPPPPPSDLFGIDVLPLISKLIIVIIGPLLAMPPPSPEAWFFVTIMFESETVTLLLMLIPAPSPVTLPPVKVRPDKVALKLLGAPE